MRSSRAHFQLCEGLVRIVSMNICVAVTHQVTDFVETVQLPSRSAELALHQIHAPALGRYTSNSAARMSLLGG